MNHRSFKNLQSLLQTVVVVTGAILLNACSSGVPQDRSSPQSEGPAVGLVSVPNIAVPGQKVPGQPAPSNLEV